MYVLQSIYCTNYDGVVVCSRWIFFYTYCTNAITLTSYGWLRKTTHSSSVLYRSSGCTVRTVSSMEETLCGLMSMTMNGHSRFT